MSRNENTEDILLNESSKLKEFERQIEQVIKNHKYAFNQEEKLNKTLSDKIQSFNQAICNATQGVQLEMYNRFATTEDIFKLRELSDQINDSCCNIETLLDICNKYQHKCEENKMKLANTFEEETNHCNGILKSQEDVITSIRQQINNCIELISNEQQKKHYMENLNETNKQLEQELMNMSDANLRLEDKCSDYKNAIEARNKKEEKLNNTIAQKRELKETMQATFEENKVKTNDQLGILNEKIHTIEKTLEDINLNVETSKESIKELETQNEDLFKENVKLEYELKCYQEKSLELEAKLLKEKNKHSEKYMHLKADLELLNNSLLNEEEILSEGKKLEEATIRDVEVLNNKIEEQLVKNKTLETDLINLNAKNANLLKLIDQENKTIEALNTDISKNTENIRCLQASICELDIEICDGKSNIEKLEEEIKNARIIVESKRKEIETAKLKYEKDKEEALLEGETNFNQEKLKLEHENEQKKNAIENVTKEKKQLEIDLEGKTLECDILARKIKTAEEVRDSLKEELKPKPPIKTPILQRKRQMDETSDSSFDGNLTVHERMLMKRKKRKAKTPPIKHF